MKRLLALAAGTAVLCTAVTGSAWAQKAYDGVTINILTRPGPVIAGRLAERGKEFEPLPAPRSS